MFIIIYSNDLYHILQKIQCWECIAQFCVSFQVFGFTKPKTLGILNNWVYQPNYELVKEAEFVTISQLCNATSADPE